MTRFLRKQACLWIAAICAAVLMTNAAVAQEISDPALTNGGWQVFADRLTYDPETQLYKALGNVLIIQGQKELTADFATLDQAAKTARAEGNVVLVSGGDRMSGRRLEMNMADNTGTLYDGFVFIRENQFRIRGDRIEKTGESTYRIHEASLTTCEGDSPDWQITGKEVDVTLEGYGYVSHAAFRVRQMPMLYMPWFMFPAKTKRQSGLLPPQASYSSRNGIEYTQPYFWAISDNTDATFYYQHLQERGEKLGVEYRYMRSQDSKGVLMFDGFEDRRIDDGSPEATEEWGYDHDNAARPNDDRYWFRAKLDQELPGGAMARLDLDVVSDQDYFREFSNGYMGYDATEEQFFSGFGRDLDDENNPVRTNRLNINKIWNYHVVNTDLVWYDDVIKRRQSDTNDTLQRLPRVGYSALKQPLVDIPGFSNQMLFASMDSEYTYFFREDGLTGHRMDLHPRIYLPVRLYESFTLEPSLGFRQTAWYIDGDREDYTAGADRYKHREMYDIGAELSTELSRVFSVDSENVEKIKHLIIPLLSYEYVPESDQSEFPFFDENDRYQKQNRMALSLTQFLTSRRTVSDPGEKDDGPEHRYNQFLRFYLEQGYDFNQSHDPELAFEPLFAELDFTPATPVTLRADAQWSYEADKFISTNFSVHYRSSRGDRLHAEYRNNREYESEVAYRNTDRQARESLYLEVETPVTRRLTLLADYERSLETDQSIETGLGFRWRSQCWTLQVRYEKEGEDHDIAFMINLYGLGDFGD